MTGEKSDLNNLFDALEKKFRGAALNRSGGKAHEATATGKNKATQAVEFRHLVDTLATEVSQKHLQYFNDLLLDIANKYGWAVYYALANRLVEIQSQQFQERYKDQLQGTAYHVLGVTREADDEVVRFSYLQLARKCHPDRGGSTETMAKINSAFQAIVIERGWKIPALPAAKEGNDVGSC
jgi:hypothetical protein